MRHAQTQNGGKLKIPPANLCLRKTTKITTLTPLSGLTPFRIQSSRRKSQHSKSAVPLLPTSFQSRRRRKRRTTSKRARHIYLADNVVIRSVIQDKRPGNLSLSLSQIGTKLWSAFGASRKLFILGQLAHNSLRNKHRKKKERIRTISNLPLNRKRKLKKWKKTKTRGHVMHGFALNRLKRYLRFCYFQLLILGKNGWKSLRSNLLFSSVSERKEWIALDYTLFLPPLLLLQRSILEINCVLSSAVRIIPWCMNAKSLICSSFSFLLLSLSLLLFLSVFLSVISHATRFSLS